MVQGAEHGMGVSQVSVEDTVPHAELAHPDEEVSSEADTETIDGASVGGEEVDVETTTTVDVTPRLPQFWDGARSEHCRRVRKSGRG